MTQSEFNARVKSEFEAYRKFIALQNKPQADSNGVITRYQNPVLTDKHVPVFWKYDLNYETNPRFLERMGVNCVFNPGAIEFGGEYYMMARVEGYDRKSFFALAKSPNGIDNFEFVGLPIELDQTDDPDVNVYDMRLTKHEDGYIYGIFCTERKDPDAAIDDTSSAIAQCGVVRTKDLVSWTRLPDLKTPSPQQRNCVLHPEFVNGKYAVYTRPQDSFTEAGSGGGIGFGLLDSMENPVIAREDVFEERMYHTIKEAKNGAGAVPIKTPKGWLHIAHGVRSNAAGKRYVIYAFLTDLADPKKVIASPGGYLIAPEADERVGDVSNVVFCNGAIAKENGELFIYYASSDTRCHVATTTIDIMLDYLFNTPPDPLFSHLCVRDRNKMIRQNLEIMKRMGF